MICELTFCLALSLPVPPIPACVTQVYVGAQHKKGRHKVKYSNCITRFNDGTYIRKEGF